MNELREVLECGHSRRNAYKLHTQRDGLVSICMTGSWHRVALNDDNIMFAIVQMEGSWSPVLCRIKSAVSTVSTGELQYTKWPLPLTK